MFSCRGTACFTPDLSGPWPLFAGLQPKRFPSFYYLAFGAVAGQFPLTALSGTAFQSVREIIHLGTLLLWYWIGSWTDENVSSEKNKNGERWRWIFLLLFIFVCAAASSISGFIGGYTSYLVLGIAIWSSVV